MWKEKNNKLEKDFTFNNFKDALEFINKEYAVLKEQLNKNIKSDKKLEEFFNNLKKINLKLWSIEDDKRMCEKNSDFGEKFIELSREIHFLNDNRSKVKLEINKYTGSQIREIKQYTNY